MSVLLADISGAEWAAPAERRAALDLLLPFMTEAVNPPDLLPRVAANCVRGQPIIFCVMPLLQQLRAAASDAVFFQRHSARFCAHTTMAFLLSIGAWHSTTR